MRAAAHQPRAHTGRPNGPSALLPYVHGYLARNCFSRRLETETRRNVAVIWLLCQLKADVKAIADFRRDSHKACRPVFCGFVLLCRDLSLFDKELIAFGGTQVEAVNKDRNEQIFRTFCKTSPQTSQRR
ncbi:MAG TPA: hypothetical protein VHO91_19525 [Rhodopila sp.]|nr:hypothetical protein [Rhodopila sp.]